MSDDMTNTGTGRTSVKTLAIRLEPAMHAQLSLIASLRGTTLTDEIRAAIEERLTQARTAPELVTKAGSALDALQDEVNARQAAISALFGEGITASTTAKPAGPQNRPNRTQGATKA